MAVRVGINGFGRIGRNFFRAMRPKPLMPTRTAMSPHSLSKGVCPSSLTPSSVTPPCHHPSPRTVEELRSGPHTRSVGSRSRGGGSRPRSPSGLGARTVGEEVVLWSSSPSPRPPAASTHRPAPIHGPQRKPLRLEPTVPGEPPSPGGGAVTPGFSLASEGLSARGDRLSRLPVVATPPPAGPHLRQPPSAMPAFVVGGLAGRLPQRTTSDGGAAGGRRPSGGRARSPGRPRPGACVPPRAAALGRVGRAHEVGMVSVGKAVRLRAHLGDDAPAPRARALRRRRPPRGDNPRSPPRTLCVGAGVRLRAPSTRNRTSSAEATLRRNDAPPKVGVPHLEARRSAVRVSEPPPRKAPRR